ncbi:hypothetical protein LCGC14_1092420 [marine sediment metagenome]|uniref:Uncharacterized protein n=1 Tax=marine sediment metagenome TaxID=412755 RepID=A0A0F9PV34_9ZZZZ
MFRTAGEIALEAENRELKRRLYYMEAEHGLTDYDAFLGVVATTRDIPPEHPRTITLPRMAAWRVSENEYGVPAMIGRTFDKAGPSLEMTFYCTPHPASKNDYINVLGELHGRCIKELADLYR